MKHVGNFKFLFCLVKTRFKQVCNPSKHSKFKLIYGSIPNLGFSLKCNLQKYLLNLTKTNKSRLVANYVTVNLIGYFTF